jgi:hypothetical protein
MFWYSCDGISVLWAEPVSRSRTLLMSGGSGCVCVEPLGADVCETRRDNCEPLDPWTLVVQVSYQPSLSCHPAHRHPA